MKNGKRHIREGVDLPNQIVFRMLWEEKIYKYLGILEADTIKQQEMKKKLRVSQKSQKITRHKTLQQEPWERIEYLGCPHRKILGAILEVDQRRTWNMDQRTRKLMKAFHPRDDIDNICQVEREEDLLVLKTTRIHRYNDSNATYKSAEEDWLHPPETSIVTGGLVE